MRQVGLDMYGLTSEVVMQAALWLAVKERATGGLSETFPLYRL